MGTTIAPAPSITLFIPELGSRKKEAVLQQMLSRARDGGLILDPGAVREALLLRERLGTTALGKGVAVPNARSLGVLEPRLIVGRSARGVDWDAPDDQPVQLVLLALSPAHVPLSLHLDLIARAVAGTRLARQRARLLEAADAGEASAALRQVTS